ncbi:hypothetical protein AKJ09_01871 [Labilithrix luteola]|uniref:BNR repeat domain protein n=1 Tax=Labilithrix luteola TaxID=1391654 RepID=A0A0K1PNX8_9BACT|nr:hypothetical protein AKJ09_01871 [Labilithrix luteola]
MSCASPSDTSGDAHGNDGAQDAGPSAPDAHTDAGAFDAAPRPRDAATSDAGPLPVVCSTSPCATSLTTTLGFTEGFCALLEDKTVACWGQNQDGQLGRGDVAGSVDSPTAARVSGLENVAFLDHTCAVDTSGATWCWGFGPYPHEGSEGLTTARAPVKLDVPTATRVGVNADRRQMVGVGCVLREGGDVVCWGTNRDGQVDVPDLDASSREWLSPRPISVPAGSPIEELHIGLASFLRRGDGVLLSWGANPPLGRVSSLVPSPHPDPVALTGVSNVDVANENVCAVAQGIAHCWGGPVFTSVDSFERPLPEIVVTPEPVIQISTSSRSYNTNVSVRGCAVGVSGSVYCWGGNAYGQAGDGTKTYALAPVKVAGLPGTVAQVKATLYSTCALMTSGKVFCWGGDASGQLGNGVMNEPSLVPIEVALP